jgi:cytochrome c-type biogenesis protein CcmH/NrfG
VNTNRHSILAKQRLGTILYEQGDYEEAAEHLTWCVNRQPDNTDLRNLAERAIMLQGKARTRLAKEPPQSTTR